MRASFLEKMLHFVLLGQGSSVVRRR